MTNGDEQARNNSAANHVDENTSPPKPTRRMASGRIIGDTTRRGQGIAIIGGVHPPLKEKSSE